MRVLIAVDDRVFGDAIADFVSHHDWPPLTEFKVLHVIEPIDLDHSPDVSFLPFLESFAEEATKEAQALVRHVALRIRDQFKTPHVAEEVAEGHPRETILDLACNWKADLVIVGSHGRRGLSRFLLGSVSSAVVSHAPCSVMVLRLPSPKSEAPDKEAQLAQQKRS